MWTVKKRIACFLVITVLVVILFTPAQGYCVVLRGNLVKPGSAQIPFTKVLILLYEWEVVEKQGFLGPHPPTIGITWISFEGRNFEIDLKNTISVDKEYVLVFSTIRCQQSEDYPSFIYGAYNEADYSKPYAYKRQPRWWNMDNIPKIKFPSGSDNLDLGTFTPPYSGADEGFFLFGIVKGQDGKLLPDVGIDIYIDQNGGPVNIPYPFYRYVKTDEPNPFGWNFCIGGLLKNTIYYIKLIANHLGYIDTFYTEQDSNVPTQFILTGNTIADEFQLNRKGARIWGYLKDKENNNPITKSVISIQAVSYTDDQQVQFMQNYVHDPNYQRFDMLSDAEKHFFGYDRFNYNSNGLYEIKGLPFEGHEYILVATELPGEIAKKFVTPHFYDGNNGVFNINQAKTISLPGAGTSYRVDFNLIKSCEGDFDGDCDVDESDFAVFAEDFGRTGCDIPPPCEGDFDNDGDVDGSDLVTFAIDFGRTDCPMPQ